MDFSFALRCFAAILTLISIALIPLVARRETAFAPCAVHIDALPRARWPITLTRAGIVCLLLSFVLLIAICDTLLA